MSSNNNAKTNDDNLLEAKDMLINNTNIIQNRPRRSITLSGQNNQNDKKNVPINCSKLTPKISSETIDCLVIKPNQVSRTQNTNNTPCQSTIIVIRSDSNITGCCHLEYLLKDYFSTIKSYKIIFKIICHSCEAQFIKGKVNTKELLFPISVITKTIFKYHILKSLMIIFWRNLMQDQCVQDQKIQNLQKNIADYFLCTKKDSEPSLFKHFMWILNTIQPEELIKEFMLGSRKHIIFDDSKQCITQDEVKQIFDSLKIMAQIVITRFG